MSTNLVKGGRSSRKDSAIKNPLAPMRCRFATEFFRRRFPNRLGELIGDNEKRIQREVRKEMDAWYRNIYSRIADDEERSEIPELPEG